MSSPKMTVLSAMTRSWNRRAELEREWRKSPKLCFSGDSPSVYGLESVRAILARLRAIGAEQLN